jgi:endoglucanase
VRQLVNRTRPRTAVLVAYNVPNRDCSQYSAGGAKNGRAYAPWIDGFADGIGRRAAIVIEPDALAGLCGKHRLANLRAATDRLAKLPNARTYVDAGHSNWQPAATMAKRLRGVHARAYALNVSNFRRTREIVAYGHRISPTLHFVVDTSRNGRGPWHGPEDWCNPPRRGQCADGKDPPAGQWWPQYALGLARRAVPAL